MVMQPPPTDPFALRRGGVLVGLSTNRPTLPAYFDYGCYLEVDTGRMYRVHFGRWTLLPITWTVQTTGDRDALPGQTMVNEGDWCYVYDDHRYSFWDGTQWRQVRY